MPGTRLNRNRNFSPRSSPSAKAGNRDRWIGARSFQPRMDADKRESNRRKRTRSAQRLLPIRLDRGEGGRRPGECRIWSLNNQLSTVNSSFNRGWTPMDADENPCEGTQRAKRVLPLLLKRARFDPT